MAQTDTRQRLAAILVADEGGVRTITLNRPGKLKAWTAVMESEVRSAMENAERDDDVRVTALRGL